MTSLHQNDQSYAKHNRRSLGCVSTTYLGYITLKMRVNPPKLAFRSGDDVIKQKCINEQVVTFKGTWFELVLRIKQVLGRKVLENLRF